MAVQTLHLINNDAGPQTLKCAAGDSLQLGAWIFPKTGNAGGGTVALSVNFSSSTGAVGATTVTAVSETVPATGSWSHLLANAICPTGCDTADPVLTLTSVPVSDVIYVDDVLVRDISYTQSLNDIIAQAFSGNGALTGTQLSDSNTYMSQMRAQILNSAKQLQALAATNAALDNSGANVSVDFSQYANGPLPSIFTVTYSGAGTSTVGINNGNSCWYNLVNDANRQANVIYNVAPTKTDYQIIRGSMAQAPMDPNSGGTPYIYGLGRVDNPANVQNAVWFRAYSVGYATWHADIGSIKGGAFYVWQSGIPMGWNFNTYMVVGANGTAQRHQLYSGSTLVMDYTETAGQPGGLSNYGAGYRYWGARSEMTTGASTRTPGQIAGCSTSDNAPPTVLGSSGRAWRVSTGAIGVTGYNAARTPVALPASSFDNNTNSPDLTFTASTNSWTVSKEGSYYVEFTYNDSTSLVAGGYTSLGFNVNRQGAGFAIEKQLDKYCGNANDNWFLHTGIFYLKAGDIIAPAIRSNNASINCVGDSKGFNLNFSISNLNFSLN